MNLRGLHASDSRVYGKVSRFATNSLLVSGFADSDEAARLVRDDYAQVSVVGVGRLHGGDGATVLQITAF
jgi:hypothetical protein